MSALGAAVGFAVFQTVQRRALHDIDVYRATGAVLVVSAVLLVVAAATTTGLAGLASAPLVALVSCSAAGVLHFGLGWTLLGVSQVHLGAARTGVLVGTVPLFGAVVAAVALAEPVTPVHAAGLVASVLGVGIVVTRRGPSDSVRATGGGGHRGPWGSARQRVGIAAGLGTALCWSVSPVLIRIGLRDLGSPVLAASVGMVVCATVYAAGLLVVGAHRRQRPRASTRALLGISGTAVGVAILLQWTAYGLARVAVVLAVLQLTPPLVVALATRIGGEVLDPTGARRLWVGAGVTVGGSLVLVLA